ncbi:MAG: hypothetical protein IH991_18910 [Planctomycetes bacterium]|nr:hypothetical protein [Planctomycetota bacterium]
MVDSSRRCPIDSRGLVFLSGHYVTETVDWTLFYCPVCDTPTAVFERKNKQEEIITWHRDNHDSQYRPRVDVAELPDLSDEVNRLVSRWRRHRGAKPASCYFDGSEIPVIAELIHLGEEVVYLWCRFCELGFACIQDAHYGWECHAVFTHDSETKTYELRELLSTGGPARFREEWLRELSG